VLGRDRKPSHSEPPPSPPPLREPILSDEATLKAYPLHWDSDEEAEPKAPELVEGMLPEVGVALLSGQWGL
jgi:hypothetical protein